jgi:hypothetical protein
VRSLVILITGNPLYSTPLPALAVLTTAVDAFEFAVQETIGRDKLAIATRNVKRGGVALARAPACGLRAKQLRG